MEEKNDTLLVSFLAAVTSDTAALQDVRIFLFFRFFFVFFSRNCFFFNLIGWTGHHQVENSFRFNVNNNVHSS